MIPSIFKKKGIRVDIIERCPEKKKANEVKMKSKQELKAEALKAFDKAMASAWKAYLKRLKEIEAMK